MTLFLNDLKVTRAEYLPKGTLRLSTVFPKYMIRRSIECEFARFREGVDKEGTYENRTDEY